MLMYRLVQTCLTIIFPVRNLAIMVSMIIFQLILTQVLDHVCRLVYTWPMCFVMLLCVCVHRIAGYTITITTTVWLENLTFCLNA